MFIVAALIVMVILAIAISTHVSEVVADVVISISAATTFVVDVMVTITHAPGHIAVVTGQRALAGRYHTRT